MMSRIRVPWTGTGVVGPGLTTFYADTATAPMDPGAVLAFFNALKAVVPAGITWQVPNSGDLIEESTGELGGAWSASGGGSVLSTGAGSYAAGVGARIAWSTAAIYRRRRVRGSTFLCPLIVSAYESNGTLHPTHLPTLQNAASGLLTAMPQLVIWSRPAPGTAGRQSKILGSTVPDQVSWLRSRRT